MGRLRWVGHYSESPHGSTSELNLLGSKLITYKKEKTGRVACNQPGGTSLLDRLLRVDDQGVISSKRRGGNHYTRQAGSM